MRSIQRDVFIVHSKSNTREDALVETLAPRLSEAGIPVWGYDDWSWERRVRRAGQGTPRSSGRIDELDPVLYTAGDPMPFRAPVKEVDEATLGDMMKRSRVVLLCEPEDGTPSDGVARERRVLGYLGQGPILIHVIWEGCRGSYFGPCRPAATLWLREGVPGHPVDEVWAFVATAWIVHHLQQKYGRRGGHRLLASIAPGEPFLQALVERSPQHRAPEEPVPAAAPEGDTLRETIEAMERQEAMLFAAQFEKWWTHDLTQLRSAVAGPDAADAWRALRTLVAGIDREWREVFAR